MEPHEPTGKRRPHPYFLVYVIALVAGVFAALKTSPTAEAWSLGSPFVNRCEVGIAVGAVVYITLTGGWLAWKGRYLPNLSLPGSGGAGASQSVDDGAEAVDGAATDFNEFRKDVDRRFKGIENALGNVINRLEVVEKDGSPRREWRFRDVLGRLPSPWRRNGRQGGKGETRTK
jgi:hypothetical protein